MTEKQKELLRGRATDCRKISALLDDAPGPVEYAGAIEAALGEVEALKKVLDRYLDEDFQADDEMDTLYEKLREEPKRLSGLVGKNITGAYLDETPR